MRHAEESDGSRRRLRGFHHRAAHSWIAGLADVVLTDILEGVPAGKALDMLESTPDHRHRRARERHLHGVRRLQRNGQ